MAELVIGESDIEAIRICPYDSNHKIKLKSMETHLVKCRERHRPRNYSKCPFNATHFKFEEEMPLHMEICPDRLNGQLRDIDSYVQETRNSCAMLGFEKRDVLGKEDWDEIETPVTYDPANKLFQVRFYPKNFGKKKETLYHPHAEIITSAAKSQGGSDRYSPASFSGYKYSTNEYERDDYDEAFAQEQQSITHVKTWLASTDGRGGGGSDCGASTPEDVKLHNIYHPTTYKTTDPSHPYMENKYTPHYSFEKHGGDEQSPKYSWRQSDREATSSSEMERKHFAQSSSGFVQYSACKSNSMDGGEFDCFSHHYMPRGSDAEQVTSSGEIDSFSHHSMPRGSVAEQVTSSGEFDSFSHHSMPRGSVAEQVTSSGEFDCFSHHSMPRGSVAEQVTSSGQFDSFSHHSLSHGSVAERGTSRSGAVENRFTAVENVELEECDLEFAQMNQLGINKRSI
ncbi:uncharacterized protein LOC132200637 isoform X3 [Neocloeon triangulifer]|uniref:uncharacterized protein LOC132200637 isoform X3 n=1 Tax=Neocloeon triangulifer TaxID=2078957 RepID=UPI00286F36BE|nr:uncharacterized protein LOC132200637 isoform X3 [Neocloeon triangulifer]